LRVVLDVNVPVSALLSKGGTPAELVARWLLGDFDVVVSPALIDELRRTLARPKIRRHVSAEEADELIRVLQQLAEIVRDPEELPSVHSIDRGDDYLLALAAAERAVLVSGDEHLLALGDRFPISTPREFLEQLKRA
jgi:putative PIN family toxin of toxin-antitoxin system